MPGTRFSSRLSSTPGVDDYLLALGLAVAAVLVLVRVVLDRLAPGFAFFILALPMVVMAGVFCGTLPAILTTVISGTGVAVLHFGRQLLAWPPGFAQWDSLTFILASIAILWATNALRRIAAAAAAAEARLAEVFRQIPGAAAIVEAPHGRLLLRSTQSCQVLGRPEQRMEASEQLRHYGAVRADGSALPAGEYAITRALRHGEVVRDERLHVVRPDGSEVDLAVYAGPVRNEAGAIVAAVGMAFDISDRTRAEARLRESEAQYREAAERLQAALDAREVLMREADHRIKNSLQLVGSLLRLQRGRVSDADAAHALDAAIGRMDAVADAHLAFQRSPDLKHLDIGRSLEDLCVRVGALNPAVRLRCTVPVGLLLDSDQAIPLGLIASEVLTNALRHAFPLGEGGAVEVRLTLEGAGLAMVITDDGVGLPAGTVRRGLGSTVVTTLARQIGATAAVASEPGRGTTVTIRLAAAAVGP
jgi:PAS domain S-box-containing protein